MLGVESIDGALRRAAAGGGGVAELLRELNGVACAAGVSGNCSPAAPAADSGAALADDECCGNGAPELDILLPGARKSAGRVLVEDVTAERERAAEERRAAESRREFYALRRFLPFAHKLVATVGGEWLPLMSDAQRRACFDVFFVNGSREALLPSLLALGSALSTSSDDYAARHVIHVVSGWLAQGGVARLLEIHSTSDAGAGMGGERFADAVQVLVSLPDRVANRLEGRVPPEFQPSVYFPRLIDEALASVHADATGVRDGVGGGDSGDQDGAGWVERWIGDSRSCPSSGVCLSSPLQHGAGAPADGVRQRQSARLCLGVAELLGKVSLSGKSRAVAQALLGLAALSPAQGRGADGSLCSGGGRVRAKGESIVAFLARAASEERAAVESALQSAACRGLGCVVSREVLRRVPTKALESLATALVKAEDAAPGGSVGGGVALARMRKGGAARLKVGGVGVVGRGAVSRELVQILAPVARERWEMARVFAEHLLTDTALPERPLARVFSVLLAVDVLDCRPAASLAASAFGPDPAGTHLACASDLAADAGDASGGWNEREGGRIGQERGLVEVAQRLAAVLADDQFAKGGAPLQQDHCAGLLVRSLLHLGVLLVPARFSLVAVPL